MVPLAFNHKHTTTNHQESKANQSHCALQRPGVKGQRLVKLTSRIDNFLGRTAPHCSHWLSWWNSVHDFQQLDTISTPRYGSGSGIRSPGECKCNRPLAECNMSNKDIHCAWQWCQCVNTQKQACILIHTTMLSTNRRFAFDN